MATTKDFSRDATNRRNFEVAISHFTRARDHAAATKAAAFDAGRVFSLLHSRCKDGEWEDLCRCFSHQIERRSIARCIEFYTTCMDSTSRTQPALTGTKLQNAARESILQSAKSFTGLLKEMKLLASGDLAANPASGTPDAPAKPQLEFTFHYDYARRELKALAALESDHLRELAPASLTDLKTDLEAALARVQSALDSTH
jgi:hypothetical protein